MDGSTPSPRPLATLRPMAGGGALRVQVSQPPAQPGAEWLTEFLRREGIGEDCASLIPAELDDEPAQKSYRGRALLAIALLLAIGVAGAVALAVRRDGLAPYERQFAGLSAAAARALNLAAPEHSAAPTPPAPKPMAATEPAPAPLPPPLPAVPAAVVTPPAAPPLPSLAVSQPAPAPIAPHQEMLSPLGNPATGFSNFPQQPVDPPPTVLRDWAGALLIPAPLASAPAVPPAAPPVITRPALPGDATLPLGTPVTLRIVYTPEGPAQPSRIDALVKRLRSQGISVTSVTAAPGPVPYPSVAYFFPSDRAAAGRVAASLARMTRRAAEPLVLLHANALPRPGTIEVRLPPRLAKELNNAGY